MDEQIEQIARPCDHCGRDRRKHVRIVGAGDVCPISVVTFSNSKSARIAALAGTIAELREERSFVWKWVERAMFDKTLSFNECMSMIANYPGAPWNQGRWDVDHKPYAKKFYAAFPSAALAPHRHD